MTRAVYGENVARGQKALTSRVLSGAEYGETAAHRGVASQHLETSPLEMRRGPPPTCEHHDHGCGWLAHTGSGVCSCLRTESTLGSLRVLWNRAQRLRPTDAVPLQRRS